MARSRRARNGGTGRKVLAGFLVLLVVLGVVFVIADRMVASYAEDRLVEVVEKNVRDRGATPGATTVDVQGFPFLTQAVRGRFSRGTVQIDDLRTNGVSIDRVDLDFADVSIPRDVLRGATPHDVRAERVRGTATLAVATLAAALDLPGLTLTEESGSLRARVPLTLPILGRVQVDGLVRPEVDGTRVRFAVTELRAGSITVPRQALDALTASLRDGLDLPLPFAVRLDRVRVDGGDLRIDASANDVLLTG